MDSKLYEDIKTGLEEAIGIARGEADPATYRVHVPAFVDVKCVRRRLGLSQAQFAHRFGFSVAAVRDWEQNRKTPEGATRAFLLVIDREPEAVRRALGAA
jgi:putative transcriptional regulator